MKVACNFGLLDFSGCQLGCFPPGLGRQVEVEGCMPPKGTGSYYPRGFRNQVPNARIDMVSEVPSKKVSGPCAYGGEAEGV